ncbi:precorrin-2 dehydrogenase/sirohydrochlorin ferrochelatase family protein [Natranaerobius thermophilus]|uniref:precorrin-2 dehydrogenase n=1 Tax=Natranaerobius thermophilus (strain ATCC BAA-1301 / DSM 18059 / JW/NM-WN-LF) TaxID=457570 RepID=B2A1G6_NATTJ|nr:bifunctional precorrin-2 dehydrogenase/sirohydrochlorin ferrochelatase [Natranaerobius thermophilus]ACB84706.1 siroheme synthase [Natranaerobius thermophilus JW/NM-WN-LF]
MISYESYPIMLNLSEIEANCVVVGGGKVASRKISSLVKATSQVVIISPEINPKIEKLLESHNLKWIKRPYQYGDLQGAVLAFACTFDPEINSEIAKEGKEKGVPVNVVTSAEESTFYVPATISRGDLNISISTQGASPALAAKLRRNFEQEFGQEWEKYVEFLKIARIKVKNQIPDSDTRSYIFNKLVEDDAIFDQVKDTNRKDLEYFCDKLLKQLIENGRQQDETKNRD